MATLNGVYITVEDESPSFEVDVTDQPVERDINISDHSQRKARTLSISGVIVGKDAAKTRAMILKLQDGGQVVKFVGRTTFTGLLTGFSATHTNKTANGFAFTLTMKEVRFATSSYVEDLPIPVKAQVVKIVNSGVKQTKTKGKGKGKGKGKTKGKGKGKGKTKGKGKGKGKDKTIQKVKFKKGSPWA